LSELENLKQITVTQAAGYDNRDSAVAWQHCAVVLFKKSSWKWHGILAKLQGLKYQT
jgi:hypothetical protein